MSPYFSLFRSLFPSNSLLNFFPLLHLGLPFCVHFCHFQTPLLYLHSSYLHESYFELLPQFSAVSLSLCLSLSLSCFPFHIFLFYLSISSLFTSAPVLSSPLSSFASSDFTSTLSKFLSLIIHVHIMSLFDSCSSFPPSIFSLSEFSFFLASCALPLTLIF